MDGELTIQSSVMPWDLPHALMTQGSLKAMTTIWSMPLALRASFCSMKVGMCFSEQVGVKAPGTATMTTFLSLNSAVVCESVEGKHSGGGGCVGSRMRTFAGIELLREAAGIEARLLRRVRDVHEGDVLREGLADERCHFE